MNSTADDFDSFLEGLLARPEKEQVEALLAYLRTNLRPLSTAVLQALQERLHEIHHRSPEETALLEMIAGLLASRNLP